jgi:hypothetical protein
MVAIAAFSECLAVQRLRELVLMGLAGHLRLRETLPNSRTHAFWILALFAAVQLADGTLTALGISRYGIGVEANPLLVRSMLAFGSGGTLLLAKIVAILGGSVLHKYSYDLVLVLLTVGYVFATVLPWSLLLG